MEAIQNIQQVHKKTKRKEYTTNILQKKIIKPQQEKQKEEEMNKEEWQKQLENKD